MAEVVKGIVDIEINTGKSAAELKILQQQINSVFLSLNKNNAASLAASQKYASSLADMINSSKVFTAESVRMRTAAGALDDTLKKGQATLGQYFSAKYVKNGALFAETLDLARQKASVLQTQFIATAKSSKGMQDALAIRPLQAFADQATIASQRTQILSSMFRQGTTQLVNFGKNVQWAGRQLMVGFTVPLTIFGTTAGRVFADLEKQTVAFKKVYGDLFTTPKEMQSNLQAVQDLGREYTKYGIAVKDTMSLAAQAAAAGRRNSDLTDAVTQATRLATLGQMDQNAALETTIALQSAFKLSGNELADTINYLNMVENQTVVSLQDIAAAIPRVAPVIQGLGGDVKDLTVFLAAMQEGGVSAEQGANALKSGLASLINPSKSATETLGKFGVNLDAIIQTNQGDLMKTVTAFAKALSTLQEFEQQQALEEVFGKYQYARLGALFENVIRDGSQAQQVMATMGYSVEDLAMTADRELKTIEEAFSVQLKAAVEKFKLAIAPIGEIFVKLAIPLVNFATSIADAFNGLPDFSKKFIAFATIITGLVIPAGTMFFGLLMNLTGTLAKLFQFMGAFSKGFLQGGIVGAFKNATQSTKYFSTAEIEAALAAQQLGTATEFTNSALRKQVSEAMGAAGAVKYLGDSYTILIAKMMEAARLAPYTMGVGQTAAGLAQTGRAASGRIIRPPQMRNSGGRIFMSNGSTVPGTGNSDTVPAMLTPGEFIVNKQATEKNLGLLYAINGGGAGYNKGGTTYANPGAYLGPVEAAERAAAELATFAPNRRRMPVGTAAVSSRATGEVLGKLNNLVYLVKPTTNKQLVGNRVMGGFDKRGVPLDQLRREMTSDIGMWMIDAYAGQKWAKTAYKTTLQNNFDSIAAKYPGKEVRFLDSKGLERIKDVIDKPEYANVKFVSVKELQNEALLNRLSPDHLQRLLSNDTENVMKQRMRTSTGQMVNRSTYDPLNQNSYIRVGMQNSWRGTKKPAGFEGAHMYGMGGKIPGVQYFAGKNPNRLVEPMKLVNIKQLFPQMQQVSRGSMLSKKQIQANRDMITGLTPTKSGKPGRSYLEQVNQFLNKEFDEIFDGMLINDTIALISKRKTLSDGSKVKAVSDKLIISALSKYDPNDPSKRDGVARILKKHGVIKGNLNYRQVMTKDEAEALQKEAIAFLTGNNSEGKKFISETSRALVRRDSSGKIIAQKGHHTSFTEHRDNSSVNEHYFGQAAFDTSNQLHNVLKQKGLITGETASTAAELAFQQKQLREQLGLNDNEFLHYNKGGMIPRFGMGGLRGKAIFERGKAGIPKIMNLSGLDSKSMKIIDELAPVLGADAAVGYAKILQKGHIGLDIRQLIKKAEGLEDVVQRKYSEWKSQNQWAVYAPGYKDVRDKALNKIRKEVTDNEFRRITSGKESIVDDHNRTLGFNRGNIVPGTGNTDTVPAMLTPGEFVVNKEATRNNMALLKAINNGSMAGYNKGGKIPGVQYFATDEQNRLVMDLATNNRGVAGPTSSLKPSMQSRVSEYMARNPAMGMGLMSAGFVLPMIGQQMQQATNKYVNGIGSFINTLTPAILAMSIFPSLIPKLFGPWGILIAAVTATAIGLKKYRESIDKAARESAKQGASAGGAANALDVMAKILGKQTPLQISLSNSVKFTDKQLQAQEESFAALQSDFGKQFLTDLQGMSSDKRVGQLVSYIQNAIASGMMDKTMAGEFARVVGIQLSDSLLAPQVIAQISRQGSGSKELLRLAEQRTGYRGGMSPLALGSAGEQIGSAVRNPFAYLQSGNIAGSGYKGPQFTSQDASYNIGLAIQSFKSAAEAQALATQELQRGAISQSEYNAIVDKSTKLQQDAQLRMSQATRGSLDIGATRQGLKDQLILGGFTQDQVKTIEDVTKKLGDENKQVQLMLQVTSGQIRPEDMLSLVDFINNKDNQVMVDWANTFKGSEIEASKFAMWASNWLSPNQATNFTAAISVVGLDKAPELQKLLTLFGDSPRAQASLLLAVNSGNENALKQFSDIYKGLGSNKAGEVKKAAIDFATSINGDERSIDYLLSNLKEFNNMSLENKMAVITYAVEYIDLQSKARLDMTGKTYLRSQELLAKMKEADTSAKVGTTAGTGPESQIQLLNKSYKQQQEYIAAINKLKNLGSKIDQESLATMSEELAIEIAKLGNKKQQINLLNTVQKIQENSRKIAFAALTSEEKQLQVVDLQEKLYSRQLTLIDRRINAKQKDINIEQDLNEVRQNGLDQISKQEEKINDAYAVRLEALDKVDRANQRNANRQKSRIDLASSLAGGDIAGAAKAAADINAQEAGYKLEDARTALETQRQRQIDAVTTSINGKLMTRKQIDDSIALSNQNIYNISQSIKTIESEKLDIYKLQEQSADTRFKLEIQALAQLTQNKDVYDLLISKEKELGVEIAKNRTFSNVISYEPTSTPAATVPTNSSSNPKKTDPPKLSTPAATLNPKTNAFAYSYTSSFYAPVKKAPVYTNSGFYGSATTIPKMSSRKAFGGMMYKGSNEPPPAIKMTYGSMVPGMGNTDRVPALLTPGEFVIRKSVASAYMPLLEQLNGNVYPGGAMPKGSAKTNPNLYNNSYSINVNVAGTDASPDEIANAVMSKIKQVESRSLRGVKVG